MIPVIVDDNVDCDRDEKAASATSATVVDATANSALKKPPLSMSPDSQMLEVRAASKRRWEEREHGMADPIAATDAENRKESVAKKQHLSDTKQQRDTTCDSPSATGISMPIKIFSSDLPVPLGPTDSPLIAKHCRSLRELIGLEGPEVNQSGIQWIVLFNYLVDFEYLLDTIPELVSIPNFVVFYGHGEPGPWKQLNPEMHLQQLVPSDPPNPKTNPLGFKVPWGVHHTKMFLVGFSDGTLRVIIHTANLLQGDVALKAQGAYVQDFPLLSTTTTTGSTPTAPPPSCKFQTDLVAYLRTYKYDQKRSWHGTPARSLCDELQRYDFTSAKVVLIPSTPGRNTLDKPKGYVKLSQAIRKHIPKRSMPMPIICQFSSIGSLSAKWLQEIAKSWDVAHADCATKEDLRQRLKLVYPTVEEIRLSVEGYNGGGSVRTEKQHEQGVFAAPLPQVELVENDESSIQADQCPSHQDLFPVDSRWKWYGMVLFDIAQPVQGSLGRNDQYELKGVAYLRVIGSSVSLWLLNCSTRTHSFQLVLLAVPTTIRLQFQYRSTLILPDTE
jgi:hypothetical protein